MFDDEDDGGSEFNRMEPDKKGRIITLIILGLALVFALLLLKFNITELF